MQDYGWVAMSTTKTLLLLLLLFFMKEEGNPQILGGNQKYARKFYQFILGFQ